MLLLIAAGVMNVVAMIALAALILSEKSWIARLAGSATPALAVTTI